MNAKTVDGLGELGTTWKESIRSTFVSMFANTDPEVQDAITRWLDNTLSSMDDYDAQFMDEGW